MDEKEVRFTEKRVDESWKDSISKDKDEVPQAAERAEISFSHFISSLGIQALLNMGELKTSGNEKTQVDLTAAQETIDLLLVLKDKTKGNLTREEEALFSSLIAELQLKFVQRKAS